MDRVTFERQLTETEQVISALADRAGQPAASRPALYTVTAHRVWIGGTGVHTEALRTSTNLTALDRDIVLDLLKATFQPQIDKGLVTLDVTPQDGPINPVLPHPQPLASTEELVDDVVRHYGVGSI
jgi:hypothetical protein